MSFKAVSARLTASPSFIGWSQVHEFAPQDTEKYKKRGKLFAVISTRRLPEDKSDGQVIDSVSAGREVLNRLHEEYFGKTEGSCFEALKSAVKKVIGEFESEQSVIEIVAVACVSDVIYGAAAGGAQLIILRNENLAKILVSRGKEVITASGYPKENDILLLGTSAFFKIFSDGVIKGSLEGKDIERAAESFAPKVHSSDTNSDLGVAFLKFIKGLDGVGAFKDIGVKEEAPKETSEGYEGLKDEKGRLDTTDFREKNQSRYGKFTKLLKFRKKGVYIKETEEPLELKNKRKVSASVGVVLVFVLVVSVFFGMQQKRKTDYKMQYESQLREAEHLLDESLSLYTIDANRSRELFNQARDIIDGLISGGIEDEELYGLDKTIKEKQGDILGEYKVETENFIDLSIITSGFTGKAIAGYGEELFVLDSKGERIISVSIEPKTSKVVAGPVQLKGVEDFTVYSDRVFTLNDEGIFEVSKTAKDKVAEKDWQGEVMLFAYTSNLYLLEKEKSDISRYVSTDSGFADKKRWLAEDINADFSSVVDWVIDGTIWVLKETGDIDRFNVGNPTNFIIRGLAPALTSADAIYTNEDTENVYVLDSNGKRVVVTDKDGNFIAQYLSENIEGAKDMVVSETERKIILLKEEKLLSIELKHL